MANKNTVIVEGTGFLGLLTIIFVTLKLIGTITWSWWWVLSPLWIPYTFASGVCIALGVCIGIGILFYKSFIWLKKINKERKENL